MCVCAYWSTKESSDLAWCNELEDSLASTHSYYIRHDVFVQRAPKLCVFIFYMRRDYATRQMCL